MSDPVAGLSGSGGSPSDPEPSDLAERGEPDWQVTLWPHRSLPRRGFQAVIAGASLIMILPLWLAVGNRVLWFVLPFVTLDIGLLWFFLRRSYRDGEITEHLRLWPDLILVERRDPGGALRRWHANPYWVRVRMHADARLESYLTLSGNGREIELGAFLSPEERVALKAELETAMLRCRTGQPLATGER